MYAKLEVRHESSKFCECITVARSECALKFIHEVTCCSHALYHKERFKFYCYHSLPSWSFIVY
jgi:hypothetical protein